MDEPVIKPLRREDGLLVVPMPNSDELVIYDLQSHRAHTLNPVVAAFWSACDGTETLPEIAAALPDGVRAEGSLQGIQSRVAIACLHEEGLLAAPAELPANFRCTRRKVAGLAAALLPVITSILAPTAAEAASLLPKDAECSDGSQCASGLCVNGKCWSLT